MTYEVVLDSKKADGITFCTNFIIDFDFTSGFFFKKVILYPILNLFFKKRLDPQQRSFPALIIPILSPKKSASSVDFVVTMMILSFLYFLSEFHIHFLVKVSIYKVGSSKTMTLDFPANAIATDNLLFWLFDKFLQN